MAVRAYAPCHHSIGFNELNYQSTMQLRCSLAFLLITVSLAAIVGMDVGTQFTKTAFVGPRKIDIVENEESKRKDPSLVGFDKHDRRVFGSKAQRYALTAPQRLVMYPSRLLGKAFNETFIEVWITRVQ